MADKFKFEPKFRPGHVLATPGFLDADADNEMFVILKRHLTGDWGDLDKYDQRANERALKDGSRLLSAYHLKNGTKVWIITEAVDDHDLRPVTTLLLPEEY